MHVLAVLMYVCTLCYVFCTLCASHFWYVCRIQGVFPHNLRSCTTCVPAQLVFLHSLHSCTACVPAQLVFSSYTDTHVQYILCTLTVRCSVCSPSVHSLCVVLCVYYRNKTEDIHTTFPDANIVMLSR